MNEDFGNRCVLFAGGGTAGHVVPALAVAEIIRTSGAAGVGFCGSPAGIERDLVNRAGFRFFSISTAPYLRRLDISLVRAAARNAAGLAKACLLLRRLRPAVVVAMGGYASVPVGAAAAMNGYPLILHEQNSVPGLANRLLAPLARVVCVSFPSTVSIFPRAVWTGNPVRFTNGTPGPGERRKGGGGRLLVFGGSQGAEFINALLLGSLEALLGHGLTLVWATGRAGFKAVKKEVDRFLARHPQWCSAIDVREYIGDMESEMNRADLVIARAGATTIAELTHLGKPSVLVPFPHATGNHQAVNARQLERAGGCRMIEQKKLESDSSTIVSRFVAEVLDLLETPDALEAMARCAGTFGKKDAAYSVFRIIMQHVSGFGK